MIFEMSQGNELLTSHSGLSLVGALLQKTNLEERINNVSIPNHLRPEFSNNQIVTSMIGLLCLGKPDFEAIEEFRGDEFFRRSLDLDTVPSEGSLRQRLNDTGSAFDSILKEESAEMIKRHAPHLTPCYISYVPIDIDISPFDNSRTKKEGVSWTYKNMDGYAPIFAYLAEEGFLINAELREGKQHCQNGTPSFLRETIRLSKQVTSSPLLVRMDSGNDRADNLKVCIEEKADWIIKRNLRQESPERWLEIGIRYGTPEVPRLGKRVYYGDIEVSKEGIDGRFRQVFKVTRRETDRTGQTLMFPEIEVETYETSLNTSPKKIIELYHEHGTSEQFHSELKTDMNLERLPSGKFSTNALVLLLGLVAYNCSRLIGQESLREDGVPLEEQAQVMSVLP